MKFLKTLLILLSLIPSLAFGATAVGWSATSTTVGIISPNLVNGTNQNIQVPFLASSTSPCIGVDGAGTFKLQPCGSASGGGSSQLLYSKSLDTNSTVVTITNSSAETTVYTYAVSAGLLGTNKALTGVLTGTFLNNSGGGRNVQVRLKYGGQQIAIATMTMSASSTFANPFSVRFNLSAQNSATFQQAFLDVIAQNGLSSNEPTGSGTSTIDSTISQNLTITFQSDAATSAQVINKNLVVLNMLNASDGFIGLGTIATGTAGQIPYYQTTGTTLTPTSTIFVTGNKIGIGTTTPFSLLTVAGTTSASCFSIDAGATCLSSGGSSGTSTPSVGSAGYVQFASTTAGYFDGVSSFFWSKANSRLGIGTTTPISPLSVAGNSYFSGNSTTTGQIQVLGTGSNYIAGPLGIGIVNPGTPLQIEKNQDGGTQVLVSNPSTGTSANAGFQARSAYNVGEYGYFTYLNPSFSSANDALRADSAALFSTGSNGLTLAAGSGSGFITLNTGGLTSAVERMRILSGGNVGIGTNAPDNILQVVKNQNDGTRINLTNNSGSSGAFSAMQVGMNTSGHYGTNLYLNTGWSVGGGAEMLQPDRYVSFSAGAGGLALGAIDSAGSVNFYSGGLATANQRMIITSTGNVGIGTTTPGALLTVAGTTSATCFSVSGGACLTSGTAVTGTSTQIAYFNASSTLTSTSSFVILPSGFVGIGTSTPTSMLDIQRVGNSVLRLKALGGSGSAVINLDRASSTSSGDAAQIGFMGAGIANWAFGTNLGTSTNTGDFGLYNYNLGSKAITFSYTTNNIGIGTSTPISLLTLSQSTSTSSGGLSIIPASSGAGGITTYLPNSTGGAGWYDGGTGSTAVYAYGQPSANSYSGADLNTISTDDGDFVSATGYAGGPPTATRAAHRIRIKVPASGVTNLDITVKGNLSYTGSASNDFQLYVGNNNTSAWDLKDSEVSPNSGPTYTMTSTLSSPANYIDGSGYVYLMVFFADTLQQLDVNMEYAKIDATVAAPAGTNRKMYVDANDYFRIGTASTSDMFLSSTGFIGIGTSTPFSLLTVNGNIQTSAITGSVQGVQANTSGVLSGTGASPFAPTHGQVVATTTPAQVLRFTSASATSTYMIDANINITAIATNVVTASVVYTDDTGASQTQNLFPMGATTANVSITGPVNYPTFTIQTAPNTTVTVSVGATGIGSQTYNAYADAQRTH